MRTRTTITRLALAAALFLAIGCDSVDPVSSADPAADTEAAESVALLIAEDTGGLIDQVGDVFALTEASQANVESSPKAESVDDDVVDAFERSYDAETGLWTVTMHRERGDPEGDRFASFTRVYQYQFLNGDGEPQRFFNTNGAVATRIEYMLLEGGGTFRTPHVSAEREVLEGQWTATGVDTDVVTVNGTYVRSGARVVTSRSAVRTHDYEMALEVTDLVGPKGSRRDLSQKISGTISGTYHADVVFERGDLFNEREIDRDFTITFENGEATIVVNGATFDGDLESGDVGLR